MAELKDKNHSGVLSIGIRHTESAKQQRRSYHMADASHVKRGPLLIVGSSAEFRQHIVTELGDDGRHGFW